MAIAVAGAACAVFVILGLLAYQALLNATGQQFDEMLQQQATLALRYADHEYGEGDAIVPASLSGGGQPIPFDVVYQIATRSGQLLYRSAGAPSAEIATDRGFANIELDGRLWRVYSLTSGTTPLVVHAAEPMPYRARFLSRTARALILPILFSLLLLTVLIGVVTERAFRPVRRIATDLAGRRAEDLSAVNTAEMPIETHALGVALNGLLARHAEVLTRERRFTADAAHELRTPLAALRAQAQVAARAVTPQETRRALDKLRANIDRTTHLMSQLLALARLEPGAAFSAPGTTPARVVVELALEDLAQSAREKKVDVKLVGCEQELPGSPEVLYLLVRNLLENSIRSVSERGRVALEVITHEAHAVLSISDDGPGIPIAERARVFERFYRLPDRPSNGSGLGLSIVGRVVELLAGDIELDAPTSGTGLVVTVRLPFAQAQARTAA